MQPECSDDQKSVSPTRAPVPLLCILRFLISAPSVCSSGLLPQLLLSFSAVRNGRKILKCDAPQDSLTSVHGLRFLSLAWVILVHTYLQVFAIAGENVHAYLQVFAIAGDNVHRETAQD
jgi:hypothetical protein